MDVEKAEHLNIIAAAVLFLFILTFVINHFTKGLMISFSAGLIIMSLLVIILLFREIVGVAILVFILVFIVIALIIGDLVIALFISSLILGIFVLLIVLTR